MQDTAQNYTTSAPRVNLPRHAGVTSEAGITVLAELILIQQTLAELVEHARQRNIMADRLNRLLYDLLHVMRAQR